MNWSDNRNVTEEDYYGILKVIQSYELALKDSIEMFEQLKCAESEVVRFHADNCINKIKSKMIHATNEVMVKLW